MQRIEPTVLDFLLLTYRASGGEIFGKTMLQKRMYFLSVMLSENLGYGPHYYGPYSSAVAGGNNELKTLGYLSEAASGWGVDHRGFEITRHDFKLTQDGCKIAEIKAQKMMDLAVRITEAVKRISDAGQLNYMELSIAAKAYFALIRLSGKATVDEISNLMPRLGWSVSGDQLEKAAEFLQKAKLVKPLKAASQTN
jgi:uncharacterized protein YwgA